MLRTFTSLLSLVLVFSLMASPAYAARDGFSKGASVKELREDYEDGKIRILIAAGHEPGFGGAQYQGVYEREINVEIADELKRLLEEHPNYEVIVTRDDAKWHKDLERYFDKNERKIEKFVEKQKKKMAKLLKKGKVEGAEAGHGVAASSDVALRLYGINKWANQEKIDLVVNLHVNDAPDHGPTEPSKHHGHSIYVPDAVYGNSKTSTALGEAIAERLEALSDVSTHPQEAAGVVPHREFIAVGAYGTLNVPSVLIEYGYITEPRFALAEHRQTVTKDTAYQTYLALQDFFGDPVQDPRKVTKLPTTWPKPEPVASTTLAVASSTPGVATTTPATTSPPVLPAAVPIAPVPAPLPIVATATPASTTPVTATDAPGMCAAFPKTLALMEDTDPAHDDVKRLQQMLAKDKTIYPEGLVTGFFGPATERAVKRLQEQENIVSSGTPETTGYGIVGPRTAKALLARCSAI